MSIGSSDSHCSPIYNHLFSTAYRSIAHYLICPAFPAAAFRAPATTTPSRHRRAHRRLVLRRSRPPAGKAVAIQKPTTAAAAATVTVKPSAACCCCGGPGALLPGRTRRSRRPLMPPRPLLEAGRQWFAPAAASRRRWGQVSYPPGRGCGPVACACLGGGNGRSSCRTVLYACCIQANHNKRPETKPRI